MRNLKKYCKIKIQLRDPVERAFSFYLHVKRGGWFKDSFSKMIKKELEDKSELNKPHSILRHGLYSENIRRYYSVFGEENIKIYDFLTILIISNASQSFP